MSRIRDIANLFSTSTDAATDAEVTSAVNTHAAGSTTRHFKAGNSSSRPVSPTLGDLYSNTETGFMEVYSGATYGWESIGSAASTPTGATATNQGSGRAYNNGQASVAFTAGSIVGRSYTVTSSPGGFTGSGTSSPITVTGLQSGQSYTYTVTATNNYGTSAASSASAGVTATTVPQAPTIGTATGADSSATLTFTAGATGGSSITNYKYSTDNSTYTAFSPAQTSSPLTISGLTNGQSYSFYLKAVNANGDSAASAASNTVQAEEPGKYESIQTISVSSNTSSVTFNSIPQTYKHLQVRISARTARNQQASFFFYVNNDTSNANYTTHILSGSGSLATVASYATGNYQGLSGLHPGTDYPNVLGASIYDILDYTNTNKYKTFRCLNGWDGNGAGNIYYASNLWLNTNAITSLRFDFPEHQIASGTHLALYGIKGAA